MIVSSAISVNQNSCLQNNVLVIVLKKNEEFMAFPDSNVPSPSTTAAQPEDCNSAILSFRMKCFTTGNKFRFTWPRILEISNPGRFILFAFLDGRLEGSLLIAAGKILFARSKVLCHSLL